jgi:putative ABC transport system substrate-binding protein
MWYKAVRGIVMLTLCLLAALLPSQAQPVAKMPRIGYLSVGFPPSRTGVPNPGLAAFRQALRDLGYVEGQTLVIEERWAEGQAERFPALAAELVGLPVDLIVPTTTRAAQAAKNTTTTIPIVMVSAGDPIANGLVASLAHPGGNITGMSAMFPEVRGKQLELLRELRPGVSRVAVLWNPAAIRRENVQELEGAALSLGLQMSSLEVRRAEAFASAFAAMHQAGTDALLVLPDPFLVDQDRRALAALALEHRLPAMYGWRLYVEAGGLMSYGPSLPDLYRRAAYYVDRILKGAKPADLPMEQPTKFELVINLKTAKALGLTIPPTLLMLADEVIRED